MKDNRIRILLLGIGGNVSQGIMTALRHSSLNCVIIGACVSTESLGLYFCDKAYISPFANDKGFVKWVSDICKLEKIDLVLSGVEENIVALEKERLNLKSLGIPFINTPLDLLMIGNNKLSTCKWLKENGLNYPEFADATDSNQVRYLVEKVGFPIIAKPSEGKGSNGIFLINDFKQLESSPKTGYVYQELLGTSDEEYTVGCYIDAAGILKGMIIMHRWLKHGTTFKAEIVRDEVIQNECIKICNKFKAVGPLNIQMRMHKGKPVCFELNVRFSGTTPMRANWGFNDVEAFIKEYLLNEQVNFKIVSKGVAYRYYNEAYIDPAMHQNLVDNGVVEDVHIYNNTKESL